MDKGKLNKGGVGNSGKKSSSSSHLHPSPGDLIALGVSKGGSGGGGSSASSQVRPPSSTSSSKTSSSLSTSTGSSSLKRDNSGGSVPPPTKKLRTSPPKTSSTSSSSSTSHHHSSSSSSSSGSKSGKIRRDPLELTPSPGIVISSADLITDKFFTLIDKANKSNNTELAQNVLLTGLKRLKSSNAKEKEQLQICQNILMVVKTYPHFFKTIPILESLVLLIQPKVKDVTGVKAKLLMSSGGGYSAPFAIFALAVVYLVYSQESHWPIPLVQLWIEDASGDRSWVDSPLIKPVVDNIFLSFGTLVPLTTLFSSEGTVGGGSGSGGGSSPNPTLLSSDDASGSGHLAFELEQLIKENQDLVEMKDVPLRNRYSGLETNIEGLILEYAADVIHKKSPDIPRNLLRALSSACGLNGVRSWVVSRLEQWLHNGKLGRVAQELLLHLCVNTNCNTSSDIEVISNISKLKMKTKPLTHFYCLALREMVRENDSNMRHVLNLIIYNELSPQRNPNNLQILGTIISGVSDSRSVLADIFMDLLQKREDFHVALKALLREICRAARFECDLSKFVEGLVRQRDITWLGDCRERAFFVIADLILLSMFLSVSPQVREASAVAAVRGEPKDMSTLINFRNLVSGIQSQAVTWMYSVVPKMYRPVKANFLSSLNKIFLKDPVNDLASKDGWLPESEKNLFGRLCLEVGVQESSLVFVLMMGVSKDHPLSAGEALDTVEQIICRSATHKTGLNLQKIEIIELLFRGCEYRHPDNISLPVGYAAPRMAVTNFYWRAWALLTIISAFNPNVFGKTGWEDYPTLKMFMEMCMTNSFIFPTTSSSETESSEEIISRELQTVAMEKEEILEFETHLAAASSKANITEATSLLLKQLMRLDPFGPPRTPPAWILTQLQTWNEQMSLGHLLCGSRNPDFLLDIIQRNSEPMPWLAHLVSEGSFEILPDQCLCEFLMGHLDAVEKAVVLGRNDDAAAGRSPRKVHKGQNLAAELGLSKEDAKLLQLLHYLQEKAHSASEDGEARKVLEYFLKRLSAPKMQQRKQALNALKLLLIKDDEILTSSSDDWLLDGLPSLPAFTEIQENVLVLLRQAILIENDPALLCRYLDFLSTWAQVSEDLDSLALDVANLVVERNGLVCLMMNKFASCFDPLFDIFFTFMKKIRGPHKESYKWSDSQDQVLVTWSVDRLEGTMNILIIHAIVILLSSYCAYTQEHGKTSVQTTTKKPKSNKDIKIRCSELLEIWFPQNKENSPKGFLLNTSEEAVLFPDWVKLKMIRSNNPRLLEVATHDLEVEQLMLFIQHFGVPIQSMTALLYIMDTVTEREPEKMVECVSMVNASFLYKLVQAQWERGAVGGEKFFRILKTHCGVSEPMDSDYLEPPTTTSPTRPALHVGSVKESSARKQVVTKSTTAAHTRIHTGTRTSLSVGLPAFSPTPSNKRKSIENLSKELLLLSSPPSNRRRSSVPASKGVDDSQGGQTLRRHSAHLEKKGTIGFGEGDTKSEKSPSKYLGQLVDEITQVEPCIIRNALEYQLPLLFGKSENNPGCRSFLMTALAHQAGWETINRCLTLFLKEFDAAYDPSAILDLIQATNSNPKLFQGVDKYVPKHQPNTSVMHLTSAQLRVMADYIIQEIKYEHMEVKGTKFSISNLLGPVQSTSAATPKKSKQGLQFRIRLWLQCAQQDKDLVDSVISSLMDKNWRNPCVKRFVHQVYVDFPEVILIDNWRWKPEEMSMSEDDLSSLLDNISHGLITALANTLPGKDWAKKQARDYEICLRKLASLHPTLLLRQISLMGSILEGRIHLDSSAFHQQNHNLPFIVFLSLFDLMQPHILRHFKQLKATFLLYFKMFKNYGFTKDYSSSLSRFSILLHNFLSLNSPEVKEFLTPHHETLRELATLKYYSEVVPLHNLISCLDLSGSGSQSSSSSTPPPGTNTSPVVTPSGDYLAPILTSMHDRLLHASNDEETIPVLQELDVCSNRNPSILNKFSENLNLLLKSESESCRTLAFSLVLKHSTYFPGKSATYLDSILQLLEDENAHLRDTMMDRVHEFVILAQERGDDILNRMFQLGISSNVNFLGPIQKSMALLRNYSTLTFT